MEERSPADIADRSSVTSIFQSWSRQAYPSIEEWKALSNSTKRQLDEITPLGDSIHCATANSSRRLLLYQSQYIPLFPSVQRQVNHYVESLLNTTADKNNTTHGCNLLDVSTATHHALRFLRLCLVPKWNLLIVPIETEGPTPLFAAQIAAAQCDIHISLIRLLTCDSAHTRCYHEASQALCNLVTTNAVTSQILLEYTSDKYSWSDMVSTAAAATTTTTTTAKSISSVRSNRTILAQTVAALFNGLTSLEKSNSLDETILVAKVMRDSKLFYNLVSNIVPLSSLPDQWKPFDHDFNHRNQDRDSATEWILRLLMGKLVIQYDLLPPIYESLGSYTDSGSHTKTNNAQVTFLHFLTSYLLDSHDEIQSHFCCKGLWQSSLRYIESQTITLGRSTLSQRFSTEDEPDTTACIYMLQILAASVVITPNSSNEEYYMDSDMIKTWLGQEITLIQDICIDLATIVDNLSIANQGKRSREMILSNYHQNLVKLYLQIVANLSFRCKAIQDIFRHPLVTSEPRTGLHVIMSCTSLSFACIGLREWAIVALRNLLEGNAENQHALESLSPQEAVPSDELARLGFSIDLDSKGVVQVVPPKSNNHENNK